MTLGSEGADQSKPSPIMDQLRLRCAAPRGWLEQNYRRKMDGGEWRDRTTWDLDGVLIMLVTYGIVKQTYIDVSLSALLDLEQNRLIFHYFALYYLTHIKLFSILDIL